jgi:hypothetical protein
MSKFFLVQAAYCITGIGFFVHDLMAKVPMTTALVDAFIWPYAQWMLLKSYVLQWTAPVIEMLHR